MSEGGRLGKAGELAEEAEITGFEGSPQLVEEQPAEEPREHADRQEEAGTTGDPSCSIERRSAARHDAMDVRMMVQVLAPDMEHGEEADLGAEMLGIGGDDAQRLGCGPQQDGIDRLLVLEGDLGDRRGQREHDMEVRHRQQQHLDDADIGAVLQQMGGEAVAPRVHRHALGQARCGTGRAAEECSTWTSIGLLSSRPGKSQCLGRANRQ